MKRNAMHQTTITITPWLCILLLSWFDLAIPTNSFALFSTANRSILRHTLSMSSTNSNSVVTDSAPFIKNCIVEVQPDRAEEFVEICGVAQAKSLEEEPGCLRLDILRITDADGNEIPNKFIVYEIFKDEAAYKYHTEQPYTQPIKAFVQSGGGIHEDAYVAKKLFLTE